MKKTFVLIGSIFALSSCASLQEQQPQQSSIQSFTNLYTYMSKDLSGVTVSENDISDALSNAIQNNTKYKYRTWFSYTQNTSKNNVFGANVIQQQDGFIVRYMNGSLAGGSFNTDNYSSTSFMINKNVISTVNQIQLKTTVSNNVKVVKETSLFIGINQVGSIDELYNDLKGAMAKNAPIKRTYVLNGEINSIYNPDSIYANFQRSLGTYDWKNWGGSDPVKSYDIKKEKTYKLDFASGNVPLNVAVYPYRNQSKVVYKVLIPYQLNSDGTATLSNAQVEQIKAKIKDIVNS